jgi:hypothetical protein
MYDTLLYTNKLLKSGTNKNPDERSGNNNNPDGGLVQNHPKGCRTRAREHPVRGPAGNLYRRPSRHYPRWPRTREGEHPDEGPAGNHPREPRTRGQKQPEGMPAGNLYCNQEPLGKEHPDEETAEHSEEGLRQLYGGQPIHHFRGPRRGAESILLGASRESIHGSRAKGSRAP